MNAATYLELEHGFSMRAAEDILAFLQQIFTLTLRKDTSG